MYIEPNYVTNEVEGSFWRPDDYMESVPNEHVIGKAGANNANDTDTAITLTISASGKQLAEQNDTFQFQSEDGIVRKLQYNIHEGELNQTDFAV